MKKIILFSAVVALGGCNASPDEFYLDCVGTNTIEAQEDSLVEPYRALFFVSETEKEVWQGERFGVPLCGLKTQVVWKTFSSESISCEKRDDISEYNTKEFIKIDRVSGQLSVFRESFYGQRALGATSIAANCSRSAKKPENEI